MVTRSTHSTPMWRDVPNKRTAVYKCSLESRNMWLNSPLTPFLNTTKLQLQIATRFSLIVDVTTAKIALHIDVCTYQDPLLTQLTTLPLPNWRYLPDTLNNHLIITLDMYKTEVPLVIKIILKIMVSNYVNFLKLLYLFPHLASLLWPGLTIQITFM